MAKPQKIARFPAMRINEPWPSIVVTRADSAYVPLPETDKQRRSRIQRDDRQFQIIDVLSSMPKGLILGVVIFCVLFGILPNHMYWATGWHWLIAIGLFVFAAILGGIDLAVVGLSLGLVWMDHQAILASPVTFIVFLLVGVVVRAMFEIM